MNFEITATPDFRKSLKALAKKYRSIKSDLKQFSESLKENPFQGTEIAPGIRKIIMDTIKKIEEYTKSLENNVSGFEDDMTNHLNEMAEIGSFGKGKKLDFVVFIWSGDPGYIPHFHIGDSETYPKCTKFQTCLKIESPEYFPHGGKYTDKLITNQLDQLIEFLKNEDEEGESNWKFLLKTWNKNSSKMKVDLKQEMPDYTILKETDK